MLPPNHSTTGAVAFAAQLKNRNKLLYYFGCANIIMAMICGVLIFTTTTQVLGINAWIKPTKFYLSVGILSFTMAWYMAYLNYKNAVKFYGWMLVTTLTFENIIITWQAARGQLSHFNISTANNALLFAAMGIVISIFTTWTLFMAVLFFRQRQYPAHLPDSYIWGIRIGLLFFVFFAFEGGQMAARLAHTVGAADGGAGLPFLNWSRSHGDLRVAHFFGMHALQVLPLAGFYFAKSKWAIVWVSLGWLAFTALLYYRAILGYSLLP
jgi:hypothetical protein